MKNFITSLGIICFCTTGYADSDEKRKYTKINVTSMQQDSIIQSPAKAKLFNMDVMLRAGFQADSMGSDNPMNRMHLDEARVVLHGDYNDRLSYRVRFRLNSSFGRTSQDNASRALDHAFIRYKFGKQNDWAVTLGKQSAMVGSYEFENNPIYEYKFSDYVGSVLNLFVVAGTLSYTVNNNHAVHAQVYNTTNDRFGDHLQNNGFQAGSLQASATPMGAYFTWTGNFMERKLQTKWSYNSSQFAKSHTNQSISLANKFKTNRQTIYLDLQHTNLAVDHAMLASSVINTFYGNTGENNTLSEDVVYQSAILRYDQFLTKTWEIALKGAYETASQQNNEELGNNFRTNYTYFAALQYKPYQNQDLRFFAGYVGNSTKFASVLERENQQFNRLTFGAYFTIPVL
ncbi:porin [Sphingobacterium hungaricum]